jgi:hypothetical protein
MKIIVTDIQPVKIQSQVSLSAAVKRTPERLALAVKRLPKLAARVKAINTQINVLKKKALQVYLVRHKADLAKAAKVKHRKPKTATSGEIDVATSASPKTVVNVAERKKDAKHLKTVLKNPKTLLRKKRMSAAMRIKENKALVVKIKALRVKRNALHDKAWQSYVTKLGKSATGPTTKPKTEADVKAKAAPAAKKPMTKPKAKVSPMDDYDWAVHRRPGTGEVQVKNPNGPVHSFHKTEGGANAEAAKFNKRRGDHVFHVVPNKFKKKSA